MHWVRRVAPCRNGNDVLHALTRETADAIAALRVLSGEDKLRGFKAFRYGAGSWNKERRFVARIEATSKGLDVRYVVTSLKAGVRHLYETLYCARVWSRLILLSPPGQQIRTAPRSTSTSF